MSNLTFALTVVGVLLLAAVVAHGVWRTRKAGPRRATPPRVEPRELVEPTMNVPDPAFAVESAAPAAEASQTDASTEDPPTALAPTAVVRPSSRLDVLIDAITPLKLEAPVAGEWVQPHWPTSRRAGSKPFLIEALNAETGEWETPTTGKRYSEFQAGVQLANRTGALNEIEYSEFVQKVQTFADAVGAMPDFPDMLEVVSAARELDQFASQNDAQLGLHLRANAAAWSVGYIQQQAAAQGFVLGPLPGRLVLPAADDHAAAPPVLILSVDSQAALADDPNLSAVRHVTLNFDVAQTQADVKPFERWQTSAQALAHSMDASVVDDNGQPLDAQAFTHIASELLRVYEQLAAREMPAGSVAARRLFS